MLTKDFWDNRAEKFGHTGYSEPFLYCFDQQARLYAIEEILGKLDLKKNKALDFGCGSGDFVELLSSRYEKTVGFDISEKATEIAKLRYGAANKLFCTSLNEVNANQKFDLILSVTVLQALTVPELETNLKSITNLLNDGGVLISMEFFSDEEFNHKTTSSKPTVNKWVNLLLANNLKIVSTYNFYNPVEVPVKSWLTYNSNLWLKCLKVFKHSILIQNYFQKKSRKLIEHYKDVLTTKSNKYPIYVIQKQSDEPNNTVV